MEISGIGKCHAGYLFGLNHKPKRRPNGITKADKEAL